MAYARRMSTAITIAAAEHVEAPWRNGGGSTLELAAEPPGSRAGDSFAWRLSAATVAASGPFSSFPGYRRTLLLYEGNGIDLSFDQAGPSLLREPYAVACFEGGWETHGELVDGPVRDINLIADPARVAVTFEVETFPFGTTASMCAWEPHASTVLALGLAGSVEVYAADAEAVLGTFDLFRYDHGADEDGDIQVVRGSETGAVLLIALDGRGALSVQS